MLGTLAAFMPGTPSTENAMSLRTLAAVLLAFTGLVAAPATAAPRPSTDAQVVEITVTGKDFEPSWVNVHAGRPVKLVVTRKAERTCATEIVMKDFGVNQALPLGKAVTVVVTPERPGQYRFACGMDMIAGVLKVQ
jgi:plastocyanin domain-containing protein